MFDTILFVLKIVLAVIAVLIAVILFIELINCFVLFCKGYRIPKRKIKSKYKKRPLSVRIFWDFPKRLAYDFFTRNPDAMNIHGIYVFAGEQGSGKTIAAIQFMRETLRKFPLIKVKSNISIDFQHGSVTHWKDLLFSNNGEIGEIDFIDEMQNWFSSNESKNFPVEMLTEVTQQRKQHKVIVGTSQVFTRLAKPIREQTRYLCLPITVFKCLTIVRVYKPELDDTGSLVGKKFVRAYFFVHDRELRECYDTYEKVARLANKGFQPATERTAMNNANV